MTINPYASMGASALNQPDGAGLTALHKACLVGDWETSGQLIEAGASPLVCDKDGRNAAAFALLNIKANRYMASQALQKGGAGLPVNTGPEAISDAEAKRTGAMLFKASAEAADLADKLMD